MHGIPGASSVEKDRLVRANVHRPIGNLHLDVRVLSSRSINYIISLKISTGYLSCEFN